MIDGIICDLWKITGIDFDHPSVTSAPGDGLNKALDRGVKGLEFRRKKMDIHHEKMRAAWTNYSSP